jgi:hypothetical protein
MSAAAGKHLQLKRYCNTVVCPRGAQVRTPMPSCWLNLLSSIETMVRFSQNAFFYPWPVDLLPVLDRLFVAFQCPPGKMPASPTRLTQDVPDVVLVVSHPGSVLGEFLHPTRGPQPALVFEAALEPALDPCATAQASAKALSKGGLWRLSGAGLLLGMAALVRPIGQVLIIETAIPFILFHRVSLRKRVVLMLLALCLPSVVLIGWSYRNYERRGMWTFCTVPALAGFGKTRSVSRFSTEI